MNKIDFVSEVLKNYKKNDLNRRQVTEVLNTAFKVMEKTIQRDKKFSYPKFGSFTLKKRKARLWTLPNSGKTVQINAMNTVTFRPSVALKQSLNLKGKVRSIQKEPQETAALFSSEMNLSPN